MRKWIFGALVLAFVSGAPALLLAAEQQKISDPTGTTVSAAEKAKQEKDVLIANINNLRNQELRVAMLQQVLSEEIAKLRNLEAVFADQYKLDVEKFRKGLYRYDDKSGKIVEQKAQGK